MCPSSTVRLLSSGLTVSFGRSLICGGSRCVYRYRRHLGRPYLCTVLVLVFGGGGCRRETVGGHYFEFSTEFVPSTNVPGRLLLPT